MKMFVVLVKYTKPLEQVDACLEAHRAYLRTHCDAGRFMVTGRRVPRTGGVLLARMESAEQLRKLLEHDPFHEARVAEYEVIEFVPTVFDRAFAVFTK
jgi:uncharacterized protein YciI